MIVGISGKKQSGKNLVANIWQALDTHYNHDYGSDDMAETSVIKMITGKMSIDTFWEQKSFAYKLKKILSLLIGCTMKQLEDPIFKEKELGKEWWYWKETSSYSDSFSLYPYSQYKQTPSFPHCTLIKPTPRLLLQEIGTNCFRDIIHPDIWINALYADSTTTLSSISNKDDWDGFHYDVEEYSNWLITDVRFKNEAESILKRGGILIRVNRFCYDSAEDFCVCNPDKEISKQGTHIVSNSSGDEFVQRINKLAVDNGYVPLKEQHTSETDLDDYNSFHYIIDNTGSIENLIEKVKEIMIKEGFIK